MIMKVFCNGTLFTVEKILPRAGLRPGTARSVGQHLTELPGLLLLEGDKLYQKQMNIECCFFFFFFSFQMKDQGRFTL